MKRLLKSLYSFILCSVASVKISVEIPNCLLFFIYMHTGTQICAHRQSLNIHQNASTYANVYTHREILFFLSMDVIKFSQSYSFFFLKILQQRNASCLHKHCDILVIFPRKRPCPLVG